MSGDSSRVLRKDAHGVLEASAEWYSIMHADSVSDEDMRRWNAWMLADPSHRSAWERVMNISSKFGAMPHALNARAANHALAAVSGKQRRQTLKLLGALCAVGVGALLASRSRMASTLFAGHRTGVGEQRQLILADGTEIWLNTETAIDVDYGGALRQVSLRSGEILIKTAADRQSPARPFVVTTEQGNLRPLGTQFTVRGEDGVVNVAVFEGAVEVALRDDAAQARPVVHAGLQMSFSRSGAGAMQPAETLRRDWIHGVLAADNMRLADFIDELGRYHAGILSCAPEVADLRIVGAFPVRDMPAILAALESTLPITVRQYARWWVSINKKSA
ncbi:FecR domain-containing protein [Herbaspirillum sp. WKF16]|uniref:FecR domain-containing protein n=1 Tax=Herbaspirillum sp. WKF16 TaxID=3028312 RepID=UPI0023A98636|nr:FecR domain-containing protein [Herbaspirillum sp. WKF16]WDZ97254.1 FecR domain-containing protein [Herbaspirillum sp. WKF16]